MKGSPMTDHLASPAIVAKRKPAFTVLRISENKFALRFIDHPELDDSTRMIDRAELYNVMADYKERS
jgi:hypothetical protein